MMDEYLVRLARVVDQPVISSTLPVLTKLPDKKQRTLHIPEIDVNMLEFLSLYGCELQVIVAERNSILGRVMLPINRLRYEIRFIHAARLCLASIDDQKTSDILQQAIKEKSAALPATFWNAVWSTDEMAQLMTYSKGYVSTNKEVSESTASDLKSLVKLKKHIDNKQFDINLNKLGKIQQRWLYTHEAGKLLKSAQLITSRLDDATTIINKRLESKPLCYKQQITPEARIVQSFFFNIYIGKIQPYLATVSQQSDAIFPLLNELASVNDMDALSDKFIDYQKLYLDSMTTSGIWQTLHQSIQRHTESWQRLLEQCGMRPSP